MKDIKDIIINSYNNYVKSTPLEEKKELYLKNWNGYYTQRASTELPDEVIELIDTMYREGDIDMDYETYYDINEEYAIQYLKDDDIDPENATEEDWECANDNNFFTETGIYGYSNYIEVIVEEDVMNYLNAIRVKKVIETAEIITDIFTDKGIYMEKSLQQVRCNVWDADVAYFHSLNQEWTIGIYDYDNGSFDFTIEFNGEEITEETTEGLSEKIDELMKKDLVVSE